jgi:hypothetical protein
MTKIPLSLKIIKLVEIHGWRDLTFGVIAKDLNIPLTDLRNHYNAKEDILIAFNKEIDQQLLSEISSEDLQDAEVHDQIQELFLYRFQILDPYKPALKKVYKDLLCAPTTLVPTLVDNLSSLNWLLSLCDCDMTGFLGFAKLQGLKVIYLLAFKEWLEDDSPDNTKTMAFLDKSLRFGERIINNYQ